MECRAIFDTVRGQHAFTGGYGSVYRFVRRLEPRTPEACVGAETSPATGSLVRSFETARIQRYLL